MLSYFNTHRKEVIVAWENYLENPQNYSFPPSVLSHDLFNLTTFIYENFDFFIKAVVESSMKMEDRNLLDFKGLYDEFLSPKKESYQNRYFYEKLFFGCSYGKEMNLKTAKGDCHLFQRVLTNNGICFSFNGQKPSNSFNSGKIVETLEKHTDNVYPNRMFQGSELHDGMLTNQFHISF